MQPSDRREKKQFLWFKLGDCESALTIKYVTVKNSSGLGHMGKYMCTKFCFGNRKGTERSEGVGIAGRIILKWVLGKQGDRAWIGSIWRNRAGGGFF
jgi:hypothetical protein